MITLRCSSAPRVMACPPSAIAPAVPIDEVSDVGTMGTAAHAVMARLVRRDLPETAVADAAELYGVDATELGKLAERGASMLAGLRGPEGCEEGAEDELTAEIIPGVQVSGHRDYWWRLAEHGALVDWKAGFKDTDHRDQVMGYADLMFANAPTLQTIEVTIAWLRDGTIEPYVVTRGDVFVWRKRLFEALKTLKTDATYRPGEHCTYCPRRYECPALQQRQRAMLAVFDPGRTESRALADLSPDEQIDLYEKAQDVKRLAEAVSKAMRGLVRDHGGALVAENAKLVMVPEQHRRVHPVKGWDVLTEVFDEDQLGEIISVSLDKAQEIYAKGAQHGQKLNVKRELLDRLETAGAISRHTQHKLKLVRK